MAFDIDFKTKSGFDIDLDTGSPVITYPKFKVGGTIVSGIGYHYKTGGVLVDIVGTNTKVSGVVVGIL